jgi:hypothetical protein
MNKKELKEHLCDNILEKFKFTESEEKIIKKNKFVLLSLKEVEQIKEQITTIKNI